MKLVTKKTDAFTELYADFYSVVFNSIFIKVNDVVITTDLTQEVFTRCYERFEEIEKPRSWLLGAMRNVLLEYYRRKQGTDINIDDVFDDLNMRYVNGFRDTRIIIQEALDNNENYTNEEERIIFELIAINNFSYKEVSEQMGLTERQARYRYKLVIERILDYLKKRGIKDLEELL